MVIWQLLKLHTDHAHPSPILQERTLATDVCLIMEANEWKSYADQLTVLKSRGLEVEDEATAQSEQR